MELYVAVLVGIIIVIELIACMIINKYFFRSKLLRYNHLYYMNNNNTFNVCINNCNHSILRYLLI